MYFGTQYYRPPFPYPQDWERDICQIKDMNFNTVKLWAVWNWIEREPGVYQFDDLDALVTLCGEYGLKVIINTIVEGAPYFTSKDTDHFYQMADGQVLNYSGPANIPSAGWPGYCPDSPYGLEKMCDFIRETAKHFKDNDTVVGMDVWNEPHLEPMFDYPGELLCYCDHSQSKFRQWLKDRYGTLEKLNETWFRQYTDWEQIEPPIRFGTYIDMIDWRRFWLWNLSDWLKAKTKAAREGAPEMMIQTHVAFSGFMGAINEGGLGNELGDEFQLAKEVDVFGLTSFPLWLMGEEYHFGHLINVEIVAEASREKDFYQTELQGGPGKAGLLGGITPTYNDVRVWNYNIIAGGGKGAVYWQYGIEPAGMESPGFGLVNSDGSMTERARSAGDSAKKFMALELDDTKRVLPVNGIYLSRSSDLLTYAAREEKQYNHSVKGIYRALYEEGIPCRFVHEDYLKEALTEGIKTLYLPMTFCLSPEEKALMKQFIEEGGRLIAECGTGMYSETGEMDMYYEFMEELFGIRNTATDKVNQTTGEITLDDGNILSIGEYRLIYDRVTTGNKYNGTFGDGRAAIASRKHGKGEAVLLPGFFGQAYYDERDPRMKTLLTGYFDRHGYTQISSLEAKGLIVRLLEDDDRLILVAVNHNKDQKKLNVRMDGSDLAIEVTINGEDGDVFVLSK